jgi:aspartate-semialdehyde dehydrogenase
MHSLHLVHKPAIAIVGSESLLGKDIHELLEESSLKAEIKLIASEVTDEEGRILTRGRDEPLIMTPLQVADLGTAKIVVLAGSPESSLLAYEQVRNLSPAPVVIDLTGALEDLPDARLRAPMVEPPGNRAEGAIQVIAHPAAIALALFLIQLHHAGAIRRAVAEVFEPASERGKAGLDELQKQTVGLLSFKPLSKEVYDAQLSFNILTQYGADSPHSLEAIELKIDRHLASLLAAAGAAPMPSLRLIQAPVFHGYSLSVWVEFEKNPGKEAIVRVLASNLIDVRANGEEPPTNVGAAGHSGITVGSIAPDRNQPLACWFWIVADNLRIAAENALEVIRGSLP